MMKYRFYFSVSLFTLLLAFACGPAAEDRKAMHERAKVFQDSIANVIRTTMAEAEGPAPVNAAPVDTSRKMINPNQVNK